VAPILTPRRGHAARGRAPRFVSLLAVVLLGGLVAGACGTLAVGASDGPVRIAAGEHGTLDPARTGDQASAAVIAQLFEGLTALDADLNVRPALASGWDISDDARTVTFHLRPDLTFSDGSPLTSADVVRSWLRIIDPAAPSPLAGLLENVDGAAAYLAGDGRVEDVAIRAEGDDVVVELLRPGGDFPAIVGSPTFAVVPPSLDGGSGAFAPGTLVSSGAYVLGERTATGYRLDANEHYWAGPPAIGEVELVADLGGRSPVDAFAAGDVDYVEIGASDASWIAYDAGLGPALREEPSLSLEFFGFDTSEPPFDDARVRRAFAAAVDWERLVELGDAGQSVPARSMVPPGVPGRSETDYGPEHDPDLARDLLADAGFPGGRGFPDVTFNTTSAFAAGAVAEWKRELGVDVGVETMDFNAYYERLGADPPDIWSVGWVADYPGPDDFLGLLLGTGRANNFGRWSSNAFDDAIDRALAAETLEEARVEYDAAESIVRDEAPVIPLAYGTSWALARDGLLGATDNGLGIVRYAGLAWDGS
jgi:oligopeptide transport system substrate-binding protein